MKQLPKLGAVLLAAGGSSRLGEPKQLVRFAGETLVRRMAGHLLNLCPGSVTVVTGCCADSVVRELEDLSVQLVHNPGWQEGMASSLSLGVQNLPAQIDGGLIVLCDQWKLELADLKELSNSWMVDISQIVAAGWVEEGGQLIGPPAIFPRNMFAQLTALKGDRGAKKVIQNNRDRTTIVTMEAARFDLNSPADLQNILMSSSPHIA